MRQSWWMRGAWRTAFARRSPSASGWSPQASSALRLYSWRAAAEQTVAVYQEALRR